MNLGSIQIEAAKLAGQRIAVLGKSGSGKTNSLGVIAEEWAATGFPLTVIDPMYQFGTLPGAIRAGRRKDADIEIHTGNAVDLAELSVKERVSVLLDMSLYKDAEALDILSKYLTALWERIFQQETPQPYMLVIDEAQLYSPQQGSTPLSPIIIDLAKRGRHKNLTTVIATQRAASIVKDFLTQATLLMAHRLTFGVDTAILREQLPLAEKELNGMMRKLVTGEALMMGDPGLVDAEDYLIAQIRKRTYTPGAEPAAIVPGAVRSLDRALKDALKKLAAKPVEKAAPTHESILRDRVAELEAALEVSTKDNDRLQGMLKSAMHITVKSPEKIGKLEVDQMVVAAGTPLSPDFQIGRATAIPIPQAEVVGKEAVTNASAEYISPLALTRAMNRQQRMFDAFVLRFRSLAPYQRQAATFLYESKLRLTADDLARRLGYSLHTIRKLGPVLEMGLLGRDNHCYFSTAPTLLLSSYPDLNVDVMISQLFDERMKAK